MENLRLLLAAMAALTLVFSVVSGANPNYFVGLNAFAEEHEDDDSGSGSNDEEDEFTEPLGENSKATLTTDDDEVELEIEVEDGDLQDGQHDVLFACTDPEVSEEFAGALEVDEGDGEFETDLALANGTYSGCEVSVGELSASFPPFTVLAHEDDDERDEDDEAEEEERNEEDDDDRGRSDRAERKDGDELVQSLGNQSRISLQIDDEPELEVEIEDGDLDDGTFDVLFACDSPDIDEEFAGVLEVEGGEGEFEAELTLPNGTYTGCEVDVGGLAATFPSFTIMSHEDDEDEREDNEGREHERDAKFKSKLKAEDDGVEIEVEIESLNMTDGAYDVAFSCEDPAFNVTFDDAFEVEDGEGEFKEEIGLANGTYSGCELAISGTDMIIASFDPFTVQEGHEEEQEERVDEKRKERRDRIVSTVNGKDVHKRHRNANPASPGDYDLGLNYTLVASGSAAHGESDQANATADIDMSVWKSNRAIILLDVTGGTVEVGNQTFTIVVGYSLYSIQHDVMRVVALAVDDDSNAVKLKLRGSAVDEDADFPMESGSIGLTFAGGSSRSNDRLGDWQLTLEGTVEAG